MIEILIDGSYLPQADCDEDGFVNFQDIEPFVAILING